MHLNIPKPITGQEIVTAFLRSAHYQESSKVRWEAIEFVGEYAASKSSNEQIPDSKGVISYPCQAKKKYLFFGPTIWIRDFDAEIYLYPLYLDEVYKEIKVDVRLAPDPNLPRLISMERYCYLHRQLVIILKNAFLFTK